MRTAQHARLFPRVPPREVLVVAAVLLFSIYSLCLKNTQQSEPRGTLSQGLLLGPVCGVSDTLQVTAAFPGVVPTGVPASPPLRPSRHGLAFCAN